MTVEAPKQRPSALGMCRHAPRHALHTPWTPRTTQGAPNAAEARRWLDAHPASEHPNAQPWNGGLSAAQFAWLHAELAAAKAGGERAIVACHHPLAPGSAPAHYLAWDHAAIRAALEEAPGVVALAVGGRG
jgi:3',5'-cyclic AMP phosphodiesterase CpdA